MDFGVDRRGACVYVQHPRAIQEGFYKPKLRMNFVAHSNVCSHRYLLLLYTHTYIHLDRILRVSNTLRPQQYHPSGPYDVRKSPCSCKHCKSEQCQVSFRFCPGHATAPGIDIVLAENVCRDCDAHQHQYGKESKEDAFKRAWSRGHGRYSIDLVRYLLGHSLRRLKMKMPLIHSSLACSGQRVSGRYREDDEKRTLPKF